MAKLTQTRETSIVNKSFLNFSAFGMSTNCFDYIFSSCDFLGSFQDKVQNAETERIYLEIHDRHEELLQMVVMVAIQASAN